MNEERLRDYVSKQMGLNHLVDTDRYPFSRQMKELLIKYIDDFVQGKPNERWVVMPGLRGVGKTTLMAQVYAWAYKQWGETKPGKPGIQMVYISLDVVRSLGIKDNLMLNVLEAYQSILGVSLERIDRPVLLFFDEVQVDPEWSKVLKTIYDRTDNVFMLCTGSAATYLQMDADAAGRRAKISRLYPLNFTEYQMLVHDKSPIRGLGEELKQACYYSSSAEQAYRRLRHLESCFNKAWQNYDTNSINHYLKTGTMPFTFDRDLPDIYDALINNVDKIVTMDLIGDRRFGFGSASIIKIKQLLTVLAGSSTTPKLSTLREILETDTKNLWQILDALTKAEMLIKVHAHGNEVTATKRPVRYFFMSTAIRQAYCYITGKESADVTRRGQALEDIAALHYHREFNTKSRGDLTYYYAKKDPGHCDFILRLAGGGQIALEFGAGNKGTRQVEETMREVDCTYGLVFSQSSLRLHREENIVKVPLRYFWLM